MEKHRQESRPSRRRFRIWVAGRLNERFIDGIDQIELGHSTDGSTLDGALIDQSHLRGILDRLWQFGIEVIKFETYLPDPDDRHSAARRLDATPESAKRQEPSAPSTAEHDGTTLPPQTP